MKLDSKVLVDLCTKAGVSGKGSALASLTDEEVVRIRAYVTGGGSKPAKEASAARPASAPALAVAEAGSLRRSDYMPPTGTVPGGRPPVIGAKPPSLAPEAPKRPAAEGSKPPLRVGPAIRVAPLPSVQQPLAPPKADEPAPQKPDIKLPPDAIRASKAGSATPLQSHIKKQELKRKAEAAGGARPAGPGRASGSSRPGGPPAPPPSSESERRDRSRRGK
ncbi:MAG TPA: hypothetical protein VGN42_23745, partial [Pirellulales bacterium]|nr:hypothetical protein [Pirellulales bacterium]